ncbi:MAG: UDP-N-acetylmuramoyl-tripeptide--D-alanyl-D-alanine ligase [Gammaproteobacteria bacterium]
MMKKLTDLCRIVEGTLCGNDVSYTGISRDSRHLQAGDLYVAICGKNFDGHSFISDAQQHGAVAAVVSHQVEAKIPLVHVKDTVLALGKMAAHHRQQFDLPVIALTGSCGKTTVKGMIAMILSQQGRVLATQGNLNNEIGVPLSLLRLQPSHEYAVFEAAANHAGEIAYTSALINPDVGLITNVGPAHIAGFGSLEGVARAKTEMYQSLGPMGIAVVNADDAFYPVWCRQLGQQKTVSFGMQSQADFKGQFVDMDEQGCCTFILQCAEGEAEIRLLVPGKHNICNALAAAAASHSVGIPLTDIKCGLEAISGVDARLYRKSGLGGVYVIDDTYNANPSSVSVAMALLAGLAGKRVLVLGDLAELGDETNFYHQRIGEQAKELGIDALYTCGQYSRLTHIAFSGTGQHFPDQSALIATLQDELNENTTILVKGSRSAHMEDVVAALVPG